jgi:hypothetical protein
MTDSERLFIQGLRQRLGQNLPVPPPPEEAELEELRRRHQSGDRGEAAARRGLFGRTPQRSQERGWNAIPAIVDPRDGSRVGG